MKVNESNDKTAYLTSQETVYRDLAYSKYLKIESVTVAVFWRFKNISYNRRI